VGDDLRRRPVEQRQRTLAKLIREPYPGFPINQHCVGDGEIVYRHKPAKHGCEDIVSKRLGSLALPLRPIQAPGHPAAPAVWREAEEDWGR
jgi:hypothetical protein